MSFANNMILMKKIISILTVFFVTLSLMAEEHLSFKGIPIEGSMVEFCQKMKAKGFTSVGKENNITLFSGDFTGRNAMVGIIATDDGKNVFGVVVFLTQAVNGTHLSPAMIITRICTPVSMVNQQVQKRIIQLCRILIQL